jgi:hypothetical protein
MFQMDYIKNNNEKLFKSLEQKDKGQFERLQNYIPIFEPFFDYNETNWNSFNLNSKNMIYDVIEYYDNNTYKIQTIENGESSKKINKQKHRKNNNSNIIKSNICDSYFKCIPLIDHIHYMSGKYKNMDETQLFQLPFYKDQNISKYREKYYNTNNTCYVDSLFSYLSSKLLHQHKIIHAIDFYGSFLGVKNNLKINIIDDIDYLHNSTYFMNNVNKKFTIQEDFHEYIDSYTRKYKKRLSVQESIQSIELDSVDSYDNLFSKHISEQSLKSSDTNIINLDHISDIDSFLEYSNNTNTQISDNNSICSNSSNSSNDSYSSRSSKTTHSNHYELHVKSDVSKKNHSVKSQNNDTKSTNTTDTMDSEISEECLEVNINKFPVQIVCLENLTMTLDQLMMEFEVKAEEWYAILMQVIMTLIIYQKCFDFTHNDLHTNNIMFVETNKPFIYYKFNDIYYKVPTFGKIFKIIDFGRAIYKYKSNLICSHCYFKGEEAATQYNFGPCYDNTKPIIEPNKSFDLCRLGCSLYDLFNDQQENEDPLFDETLFELIKTWITDDDGNNILYKKDGCERYPGFKLYKMISRKVHNHIPDQQLDHPIFKQYVTDKKTVRKFLNKGGKKNDLKNNILDIDSLPIYYV